MLMFSLKQMTFRKITIDNSVKSIPKKEKLKKKIVNQR